MKPDYDKNALIEGLRRTGVETGDIAFIHVSLGRLGIPAEGGSVDVLCRVMAEALREAVGSKGAILVPTYTYSIGKKEVFDPALTPSTIGVFTDYFRTREGAFRSVEPMLSVSGKGSAAQHLLSDLPPTSYGRDCLYDRLVQAKAKICCLGLGLHWATFRHHIEQMAEVPFRFCKYFNGVISENGKAREVCWEYFAAPQNVENCEPHGQRLQVMMEQRGLTSHAFVGRGKLSTIPADVYFREGYFALKVDPWFSAKGPECKIIEYQ